MKLILTVFGSLFAAFVEEQAFGVPCLYYFHWHYWHYMLILKCGLWIQSNCHFYKCKRTEYWKCSKKYGDDGNDVTKESGPLTLHGALLWQNFDSVCWWPVQYARNSWTRKNILNPKLCVSGGDSVDCFFVCVEKWGTKKLDINRRCYSGFPRRCYSGFPVMFIKFECLQRELGLTWSKGDWQGRSQMVRFQASHFCSQPQ